jgi:hypothetical protein
MARKSKMTVLKRQREVRKAEKAALKRERRELREGSTARVATKEDLEAYGSESASDQDDDR